MICDVFTGATGSLAINVTLKQATNPRQLTSSCEYPVAENFTCRIPYHLQTAMLGVNKLCSVECDILDPYQQSNYL